MCRSASADVVEQTGSVRLDWNNRVRWRWVMKHVSKLKKLSVCGVVWMLQW
jgi:hypothetical protein